MLSRILEAVISRVAGYVAAVLALAGLLFAIWTFASEQSPDAPPVPTVSGRDSVLVSDPSRPIFERELPISTSEGGARTQHEESAPPEDRENRGTISVVDSSGGDAVKIAIQPWKNAWFPDWGAPDMPVRALNATPKSIVWTPASKSLLAWDSAITVGTGFVFGRGGGLTVGYVPVRVWAFRVGAHVHIPPASPLKARPVLSIGTQVKEHLSIGVGLTPRLNVSVSVRYRF